MYCPGYERGGARSFSVLQRRIWLMKQAATGMKLNANVNSQRKKMESEEDIKEES